MTTSTEIQVTRNTRRDGSLAGMTWQVDETTVATITPSRRRADSRSMIRRPWYVRLYIGPDEYDLFMVGDLTAAKALAQDHAEAF